MEWSVWIGIDGTNDENETGRLLEALAPHSPAITAHAWGLEAHFTVDAPAAWDALYLGMQTVKTAAFHGPIHRLEVQPQSDVDADLERPNFPELVGHKETAAILGVSKQRLDELLRTHPEFPRPVVQLAAGPIWIRSGIKRFLETWPRRAGRPPKADQQRRTADVLVATVEHGRGRKAGARRGRKLRRRSTVKRPKVSL
jgi:hypothetical protein